MAAGITLTTLKKIEAGRKHGPWLDSLEQMCEVLAVGEAEDPGAALFTRRGKAVGNRLSLGGMIRSFPRGGTLETRRTKERRFSSAGGEAVGDRLSLGGMRWVIWQAIRSQYAAWPGVRAKGMTSRMFGTPVTNMRRRSKPRP